MKNWWRNDLSNLERFVIKWMFPVFGAIVLVASWPALGATAATLGMVYGLGWATRIAIREDRRTKINQRLEAQLEKTWTEGEE